MRRPRGEDLTAMTNATVAEPRDLNKKSRVREKIRGEPAPSRRVGSVTSPPRVTESFTISSAVDASDVARSKPHLDPEKRN